MGAHCISRVGSEILANVNERLVIDEGVVAGNVYDKYGTRNPVARWLMRRFLAAFRDLVRLSGAREAHEVGCGEGRLAVELAGLGLRVRASDFSSKILAVARTTVARAAEEGAIELRVASVYDLTGEDAAELIVCCEVLEHLDRPAEALRLLEPLARPHAIFSVPREPLWRLLNVLRGRYLGDFGNTPGHLQHWSRRRFLAFLGSRFDVVAVRCPLPWTMALCRSRRVEPSAPGAR